MSRWEKIQIYKNLFGLIIVGESEAGVTGLKVLEAASPLKLILSGLKGSSRSLSLAVLPPPL